MDHRNLLTSIYHSFYFCFLSLLLMDLVHRILKFSFLALIDEKVLTKFLQNISFCFIYQFWYVNMISFYLYLPFQIYFFWSWSAFSRKCLTYENTSLLFSTISQGQTYIFLHVSSAFESWWSQILLQVAFLLSRRFWLKEEHFVFNSKSL